MMAGGHAVIFSFVHTAMEPGVSYCIAWTAGCPQPRGRSSSSSDSVAAAGYTAALLYYSFYR